VWVDNAEASGETTEPQLIYTGRGITGAGIESFRLSAENGRRADVSAERSAVQTDGRDGGTRPR